MLTILVLAGSTFLLALGMGLAMPLMPVLARALGAGGFMVGLVFAVNPMMRAIMMPIFGRMSDIRGKKALLVGGLGGSALAALALGLATAPWHLVLARLAQGVLAAGVIPVVLAYAGELAAEGGEGSMMGWFTVTLLAGFGGGPMVGGAIAAAYGIDAAFWAMAGLLTLALILVLWLLPERAGRGVAASAEMPSLRAISSDRVVRGLLGARALSAASLGVVFTILPLYGTVALGLDSGQVGIVISVQLLAAAPLQPLFGRLADRFDRVLLSTLGLLVAPGLYLLLPLARGLGDLILVSALLSVGLAMVVPASTAMVVNLGRGMGMGSLMGLMEMAIGLGMAVGGLVAGAASEALGLAGALRLAAAPALLAAVVMFAGTRGAGHPLGGVGTGG